MPSPYVDVVMGLFESYLNIRKSNWSLDENDPMKSSLSYTRALKRDVCVDSLQKINLVHNINNWNTQLKDLIAKADVELENAKNSSGFFSIWRRIGIVDRPLLLETLCAVISYINANLPANKKLTGDELTHFNRVLEELNQLQSHNQTHSNYHLFYYDQIIKVRNPAPTPLIEESFDDFVRNVENHYRTLTITQKIINDKNKIDDSAPPLAPTLSSTAQLAAATSLSLLNTTPSSNAASSASSEELTKEARKEPAKLPITLSYAEKAKRHMTRAQAKKNAKLTIINEPRAQPSLS